MVKTVSSVEEAWDILRLYDPDLTKSAINLDQNNRVDIHGDIILTKLFGYKYHPELPLKFGKVTGKFKAGALGLTTLEGAPSWVGKHFDVNNNNLKTLVGGPEWVGGIYDTLGNYLDNLDGLASHIGDIFAFQYSSDLPLLRALVAPKILTRTGSEELKHILAKYAGQGKMAVFDCQKDLEDAGFEENARW